MKTNGWSGPQQSVCTEDLQYSAQAWENSKLIQAPDKVKEAAKTEKSRRATEPNVESTEDATKDQNSEACSQV